MKLNHVLVLTRDLKSMTFFWTNLIGLQLGERPPFPFNGVWIYSEDKPLIHIVEQYTSAFGNGSIAHVAIEGADYKTLRERLDKSTYAYTEKIVPLSEELQVFIIGPEGLTIEMLFPLDKPLELPGKKPQLAYQTNDNFEFLRGKI